MDAGSFTLLRLLSGAVTLSVLTLMTRQWQSGDWQWRFALKAGLALFGYALLFSYAYLHLSTGTGALLLFGSVQMSLLVLYRLQGNHLSGLEMTGMAISVSGFVYLMLPSATRPDLWSAIMMILSGVSWALFTLLGKQASSPQKAITQGFVIASLLCLVTLPWLPSFATLPRDGVVLALGSGAVASGLGYVVWYYALTQLTLLQASISQLAVPAIAALMGTVLLAESLYWQQLLSGALVLGGIACVFIARAKQS